MPCPGTLKIMLLDSMLIATLLLVLGRKEDAYALHAKPSHTSFKLALKCRSEHVQILGNLDAGRAYLKTQETLACEIELLCRDCRIGIALVHNIYSRGSLLDALPVRPPKDVLHSSNRF